VPLIYLNLHTAQNPGGEIRGQLVQLTGPTPAPPSPPSPVSTREIIVPLLLGESENRLQGSSGSVPFIKSYNATAHSGVDTTARSSNIVATITPQTQEIRFSDIVIRDLPVDVTAAHIHGPCADATPCSNGPVVYTICSPCPTSSGNTATIPGFTVDLNQLNGNFSTAIGLYQGIMYSNRLYYLNFHTQRNPGGEIRVDLIVPGGRATIRYDADSIPSNSNIGGIGVKVIPAKLTISSLGSLSGPPTAIHIHGPVRRSAAAGVLITLCQGNCPADLLNNSHEFSIALPLELVAGRSTYINVHTAAFPGGEIRGQISPEVPYAVSGSSFNATSDASMFQEGDTRTLSYTANAQQEIPPGASSASAAFSVTFHTNNGSITFSSITTSD